MGWYLCRQKKSVALMILMISMGGVVVTVLMNSPGNHVIKRTMTVMIGANQCLSCCRGTGHEMCIRKLTSTRRNTPPSRFCNFYWRPEAAKEAILCTNSVPIQRHYQRTCCACYTESLHTLTSRRMTSFSPTTPCLLMGFRTEEQQLSRSL